MNVRNVPLPPQQLIFMDRDAESGFQQGKGLAKQIEGFGVGIQDGTILDIGCGWGRLSYALLDRGFNGRYVGIDILKSRIDWLNNKMNSQHKNFEFYHYDVSNGRYNKDGIDSAVDLKGPLQGELADTVILLSVFTHIYPTEIINYIADIRRNISPHGTLVFTCFLWDDVAQEGIRGKKSQFSFSHAFNDETRFEDLNDPLYAIAYTEDFFKRTLAASGFSASVVRGRWSGAVQSIPYQDWIIAKPV